MNLYVFLYQGKRKTVLFKVQKAASCYEKKNLKRHYETNHSEFKKLDGELRKMKIEEFKKNLYAQQSVMASFLQYK